MLSSSSTTLSLPRVAQAWLADKPESPAVCGEVVQVFAAMNCTLNITPSATQNKPPHRMMDSGFLDLHAQYRVDVWNILTLKTIGAPTFLPCELNQYNILMAGLRKTHWSSAG